MAARPRRARHRGARRTDDRPAGLAHVLGQVADGHVAGVVVARLGDVTHSVSEMASLMDWIDQAGGFLIAIDYDVASTGCPRQPPEGGQAPGTIRGRWDAR